MFAASIIKIKGLVLTLHTPYGCIKECYDAPRDRDIFHVKPSTAALAMTFLTPPRIFSCYNRKRDTLSGHAEAGRSGA